MVADGMTKAMARDRHVDLLAKMGVRGIVETATPSLISKQTTKTGNIEDLIVSNGN